MKKSTFFLLLFVFMLLVMTSFIAAEFEARTDQKRAKDMKRCVELDIQPDVPSARASRRYGVRFEDEFFCPTRPYTVLEALNRAESVLNTRGKLLEVVLKNTPEGTILVSVLGKANGASGQWELKINGSETFTQPLDKIVLQGASWITFVYH